jgi:hypothetical protein
MTLMDGAFAQEKSVDNAALVLNAYYQAPLTTSRLNQKAMIVSGEELLPLLEVIEVRAEKLAVDEGHSPVPLTGADLAKADLSWDRGACGFPSYVEFTKHFKKPQAKNRK